MRSMGLIGTIYRTIFFELKNLPSKSACARLIRFRLNANGAEFIQEIQLPAQFPRRVASINPGAIVNFTC